MKSSIAILAFAGGFAISGAALAHGHGHSMGFTPSAPITMGAGQGKVKFDAPGPQPHSDARKSFDPHEVFVERERELRRELRHREAWEHWRRRHHIVLKPGYGIPPTYLPGPVIVKVPPPPPPVMASPGQAGGA